MNSKVAESQGMKFQRVGRGFGLEHILLVTKGCTWRKCSFCTFWFDSIQDPQERFEVNKAAIQQITGYGGVLECTCSGSMHQFLYEEKGIETIECLVTQCLKMGVKQVILECDFVHLADTQALKTMFTRQGIQAIVKVGIETFNDELRNQWGKEPFVLRKDPIGTITDLGIKGEGCLLLIGPKGDSRGRVLEDIALAGFLFEYITIHLYRFYPGSGQKLSCNQSIVDWFQSDIEPTLASKFKVYHSTSEAGTGVVKA